MLPPLTNNRTAAAISPRPIQIAHQSSLENNSLHADARRTSGFFVVPAISATKNSSHKWAATPIRGQRQSGGNANRLLRGRLIANVHGVLPIDYVPPVPSIP